MSALILKDGYVLLKQMKFFLVFILITAVIPGSSTYLFGIVYVAMLPYTALAYDERSKWDQLAGMMPYSVGDIVMSKYVLGWVLVGGTAVLTYLIRLLLSLVNQSGAVSPVELLVAASGATMVMALTMPFMFRFGVERGRIIYTIAFVGLAVGFGSFVIALADAPSNRGLLQSLALVTPVVTVAVNAVSAYLSVKMYRKGC